MDSMLDYLKRLFVTKDTRPGKKDYVSILGLLWVCNIAMSSAYFFVFLRVIYMKLFSTGLIAGLSLLENYTGSVFPVGLPWGFALLTGSWLLVRRVYGWRHLWMQIAGGVAVFVFFRSLLTLPLLFLGDPLTLFTGTGDNLGVGRLITVLGIAGIPVYSAGFLLVLVPILRPGPADDPKPDAIPGRLDRGGFTRAYALLSISTFLSVLLALVTLRSVFGVGLDHPAISLSIAVIGVSSSIVALILVIRRIRETGRSFLLLLLLFVFPVSSVAGITVITYVRSLLALWSVDMSIGLSLSIFLVFLLWLMLAPARRKST